MDAVSRELLSVFECPIYIPACRLLTYSTQFEPHSLLLLYTHTIMCWIISYNTCCLHNYLFMDELFLLSVCSYKGIHSLQQAKEVDTVSSISVSFTCVEVVRILYSNDDFRILTDILQGSRIAVSTRGLLVSSRPAMLTAGFFSGSRCLASYPDRVGGERRPGIECMLAHART